MFNQRFIEQEHLKILTLISSHLILSNCLLITYYCKKLFFLFNIKYVFKYPQETYISEMALLESHSFTSLFNVQALAGMIWSLLFTLTVIFTAIYCSIQILDRRMYTKNKIMHTRKKYLHYSHIMQWHFLNSIEYVSKQLGAYGLKQQSCSNII